MSKNKNNNQLFSFISINAEADMKKIITNLDAKIDCKIDFANFKEFAQEFFACLDNHGLETEYKLPSLIDSYTLSKFTDSHKQIKKSHILSICVSFKLGYENTKRVLELLGFSLSNIYVYDQIIIRGLKKGWSIDEVNYQLLNDKNSEELLNKNKTFYEDGIDALVYATKDSGTHLLGASEIRKAAITKLKMKHKLEYGSIKY